MFVSLRHSEPHLERRLKLQALAPIIVMVVDSQRSRGAHQHAGRTAPGSNAESAPRGAREPSSHGPASRVLSDHSSHGPASRVLSDHSSHGPASRVVEEASSRSTPRAPADVSRPPLETPRTGRTQQYDLLHSGDSDLVACVGPCLVVLSHQLTLAAVEAMGRGMAKLEHRYGKFSSISFVERKSGPSTSPEARDRIAELVRNHAHSITGAAVVCEGTGFRATAVRSVVTAIHMASRSSHSSRVFAEPGPALEWLASTRSDGAIDVKFQLEAAAHLRAKLQAQIERAAARVSW